MILQGVNGLIIRDRGRANPYSDIGQLMSGPFGQFGGLPNSPREYITETNGGVHPSETNNLVNNPDGLLKISNWSQRWDDAVTLSNEVDQIRGDPASGALVVKEQGLANSILASLMNARGYYPWGAIFSRSGSNQMGLDAALASLDNYLNRYMNEVGPLFQQAQKDITDRIQIAAQTAIDQQKNQDALAILQTRSAVKDTTVVEAQRADASVVAYNAAAAEAQAKANAQKIYDDANAPKLFGLPLSVVVPVGIAGAVGLTMLLMHKPAPSAMGGYRRRRAR